MKFGHPGWLVGGLVACLGLIWLWRRYDAVQHAALARFVSAHLRAQLTQSVSIARRRVQRGFMLAALGLLFVALAGPLVGFHWEQISRRGNNIVIAVDTSRSMTTPDVKPDRLTRAKLAIDDFTRKLDGDAVGLVAFAGDAFLVCPITLDYGAFHESLNAIDTDIIPRGGTNIASAIHEAQAALRRRPGSDKILILVTDGEDLEGDALVAAQAAASQDSLKIYTIGVGTAQGDLIPVSADRGSGFVKDDSGAFVKSHLDEDALKAIATATGGLYAPLGAEGQGLDTIYQARLAPLLKHDLASRQQRVYIERYQWPLAGSLALLLLSQLIGNRRRVRRRQRAQASEPRNAAGAPAPSAAAATALPALALLLLLLPPLAVAPAGSAVASTRSADEAYKKGDFVTAAKQYADAAKRDPQKPALQYNAGTAAYRAGQFPQAAQAFQESISRSPAGDAKRLADQQDAYYNLGNTLYRTGQATEEKSPQEAIKTWEQSVKAYDTALQLRAADADSKYNRDFVKRKLDELKKKQNQDPNQNQGQGQGKGQGQNPPPNSPPQSKNGAPPGQPPPGQQQPPPGQQQPPPGQQQPAKQPQQRGQQPPPSADQPKPGNGQPKAAPQDGEPQPGEAGDQDDTQHAPGQMSREEARELLDSQKGDEHHARGLPFARRESDAPPDKPVKDW